MESTAQSRLANLTVQKSLDLATVQGPLEAAWRHVEASDDLLLLAETQCALCPPVLRR